MKMEKHIAIVIKDEDNKILFIQRSLKKKTLPGIWAFPSGTCEDNENAFDTAIREANEELGVEVIPKSIFAETNLSEFSVHLIFILCCIKQGEPKIMEPNEIDKINWMPLQDFFDRFSDNEIGHGLIWIRKNPEIISKLEKNIV